MRRGSRGLIALLVILVLLALLTSLLGSGMWGGGMMGWYGSPLNGSAGGWMWGLGMGLGWLAMLVLWGAIIAGAVWLFTALTSGSGQVGPRAETALDILKRRFAAGEISSEDYERMRRTLEL